jgi:hypothetical protein
MQRFGNWICFRPQLKGETPTLFSPLYRAKFNHTIMLCSLVPFRIPTMDILQNPRNSEDS